MLREKSDIGIRIRDARLKKKLTQQELADKIGVHVVTISQWENGVRKPNDEQKDLICKYLGGTMYTYFFEK